MNDGHNGPEMDNARTQLMHGNKTCRHERARGLGSVSLSPLMNLYRFFICLSRTYDKEIQRGTTEAGGAMVSSPPPGPLKSGYQSRPAAVTLHHRAFSNLSYALNE